MALQKRLIATVVAVSTPALLHPVAARSGQLQPASLPLHFEANQGQAPSDVRFLARGQGYTLLLTSDSAVLRLQGRRRHQNDTDRIARRQSSKQAGKVEATTFRIQLAQANTSPAIVGLRQLSGRANYFIGRDPNRWHTNVPLYASVVYKEVYPGIDLVYYGNQHNLEYDFVVSPGANPERIELIVDGAEAVRLGNNGNLAIQANGRELLLLAPIIYQEIAETRRKIGGGYTIKEKNRVAFQLASYDATRPLVIDPILSYSTYLGGDNGDAAMGIALDSSGNIYLTGSTSSTNFPTVNPLQGTLGGTASYDDVFVSKLSPGGSALVYSTYLGGNYGDAGLSIAADSAGNAYVVGLTHSADFPTGKLVFATASDNENNSHTGSPDGDMGRDISAPCVYDTDPIHPIEFNIFVTEAPTSTWTAELEIDANDIDPSEADEVFLNGFYAGSLSGDDGLDSTTKMTIDPTIVQPGANLVEIVVDENPPGTNGTWCAVIYEGRLSLRSFTPAQGTNAGDADGFVVKLNAAGSTMLYSTYLGGTGHEEANAIALDSLGNAYVAGRTDSTDFPTLNAIQPALAGGEDAFVTKLNSTGSAFYYSTYLGGGLADFAFGIARDGSGNAYVAGGTYSADFPTVNAIQNSRAGASDAFVTKINAAGSAHVYSTFLGGTGDEVGWDIAVGSSNSAYVVGTTWSTDFPTANPIQPFHGGGSVDAFVTKLDSSGSAIEYSTYLGGKKYDFGSAVAVDASGSAYVVGETTSTDFPTANPIQSRNAGGSDLFVSKLDPTGSALVYSTYLGGTDGGINNDTPVGDAAKDIAVDSLGNAYITGLTDSTDFPLESPIQGTYAGDPHDGFLVKLDHRSPANKTQQACVNQASKGAAKVAKSQGKENASCVNNATKGSLAGTAEECLTADSRGKVGNAKAKNLLGEQRKCVPGDIPAFGYASAATANTAAVDEEINLLHDIFGPDLDGAIIDASTDRAGAGCQVALAKAYEKVMATKLKQFLRCLKSGLSGKTSPQFIDAPGIEGCLSTRPDSVGADPAGKVSKALGKLATALSKKCQGVNMAGAFPGQCSGAGDFLSCLDERVECRVCLMVNTMCGLGSECDLFDDTAANGSCPPGGAPTTTTTTSTTTTTL